MNEKGIVYLNRWSISTQPGISEKPPSKDPIRNHFDVVLLAQ